MLLFVLLFSVESFLLLVLFESEFDVPEVTSSVELLLLSSATFFSASAILFSKSFFSSSDLRRIADQPVQPDSAFAAGRRKGRRRYFAEALDRGPGHSCCRYVLDVQPNPFDDCHSWFHGSLSFMEGT